MDPKVEHELQCECNLSKSNPRQNKITPPRTVNQRFDVPAMQDQKIVDPRNQAFFLTTALQHSQQACTMAQTQKSFWKNTQNFLLTLGNANARRIINLKDELNDVQKNGNYQLKALSQTDLKSLKNLRKALLTDVNWLRAQNNPAASLKVIETALKHDVTSSQLEAARARALAALNQHDQAIQIWQAQASSDKLKIKQQARTEIRIYEQSHRSSIELLHSLRTALRSELVTIKHLPETAPHQLSALEIPALNEAIELRKNKNEQLSLKLLELCIQHGVRTDLIDDNKARSLHNLGFKREAIHIWQSLLSSQNQDRKDSAQKILTKMSQNLLDNIKKTITSKQHPIRYLPEQSPHDLSKLGLSILKEAIELRKAKHEDLSLQILELTASAGFETDAINENRARALINLKRNTEAVQLLQELLSSKKKETKDSTKRILKNLGQNLLTQSRKILTSHGWQIRHLPEHPPELLMQLEPALLKEAIDLRKEKQEILSLKLLDLSIQSGLKTERIDDNRARALVNKEKYMEAVSIWNTLKESKNPKMQETALSMLRRFGEKGFQQRILKEVDSILMDKKDNKQAINLLTDAILQNPNDDSFHEKLGEVAMKQSSENNQSEQQFEELADHSQALAGFEAFVTALEQRYKPALESANDI